MTPRTSPQMHLLHRIAKEKLSRNKHFRFFQQQSNYRVLRVYHYLESLAHEIIKHGNAEDTVIQCHEATNGQLKLTIHFPALKSTHAAYLTRDEFTFLCRHAKVCHMLQLHGITSA